jgi:hypothetical protein
MSPPCVFKFCLHQVSMGMQESCSDSNHETSLLDQAQDVARMERVQIWRLQICKSNFLLDIIWFANSNRSKPV